MSAFIAPTIAATLPFLLQKLFGGSSGGSQGQGQGGGGGGNWFSGTPGSIQALPNFSPEQQGMLGQIVGGLGGQGGPMSMGLQNLMQMLSGDDSAFEDQAMRQFNEQIVPGISERFSSMGAGNQGSSAFGQQLGQAGAGLSENLAVHKQGIKNQGMSQLMQMLGIGMTSPFQYQAIPGQEGGLGKLLSGLGGGLGQAGGQIGASWLSKMFSPKPFGSGSGQMYSPGYGYQSGG